MTSYLIIILIPTILYFIDENSGFKKGIFKKTAILFLIVVSGLRYGFGADYKTYYEAFIRMQNGILTDKFEWGYKLLNIIVAKTGVPFQVLLFVIAIFNLTLIYKSIEENVDNNKWLSIFLYLVYFDLFFYSLSAIRQSIVISIVVYTLKYIENQNFKKYFIWIIFGAFFHSSALIMIPVYFMYQFLRKQDYLSTMAIMIGITGLYIISIRFIPIIRPYIGSKLGYYLFIFDNSVVSYNIVYVIITELAMVAWIYFSCFLRRKYFFTGNYKSYTSFLVVTVFLSLKIFQYMQYFSIIPRMQMYFYCVLIIAIPNIIKIFPIKFRPFICFSIFIFFIINFIFRYYEVNITNSEYYESFKLIFNR